MKIDEMIKVMQHYENGGVVEYAVKDDGYTSWRNCPNPIWDWFELEYRIKRQKQKVTIEKWLMRGDTGCCFVLEGDSSYFEGYQNITKVKLLESYEVEITEE